MIHRKMEIINFIGMPISIMSSGPRTYDNDDDDKKDNDDDVNNSVS
jgi:hypothetical protein